MLEAEQVKAVHARILEDLGKCDILINGAGGNNKRATTDNEYQHEAKEGQTTFFDLDTEGVDFVFRLNFQGTLIPITDFCTGYGRKAVGKYFKYFFDECVYTADQNSGIFGMQKRQSAILPSGLPHILREAKSAVCYCTRFFSVQSEPRTFI